MWYRRQTFAFNSRLEYKVFCHLVLSVKSLTASEKKTDRGITAVEMFKISPRKELALANINGRTVLELNHACAPQSFNLCRVIFFVRLANILTYEVPPVCIQSWLLTVGVLGAPRWHLIASGHFPGKLQTQRFSTTITAVMMSIRAVRSTRSWY